jgi:hypothetical protein
MMRNFGILKDDLEKISNFFLYFKKAMALGDDPKLCLLPERKSSSISIRKRSVIGLTALCVICCALLFLAMPTAKTSLFSVIPLNGMMLWNVDSGE